MNPTGESSPAPITIENFSGTGVFATIVESTPEIPDEFARQCPQCSKTTWKLSRWCWNCKFDFDRATMHFCHPIKLLYLSTSLNVATCAAIALVIWYHT